MTNAPETRKTHVIRILGTNRNGDILPDLWVDVERMDLIKYKTQTAAGWYQGAQDTLRWMDDPTADDYNPDGNPARKTINVKVCDPSANDVNDPDEWVNIPVIVSMKTRFAGGSDTDQTSDSVGGVGRFVNSQLNKARVVETRRIEHYDTNIDDAAQAAFSADPTLKAYVVPGDQYTKDDSSADDSQYVEHEVIKYLKLRGNQGTISARAAQTKLLNEYLIDESEPAQLDVVGENGINPPYRLDPYQNIVNVSFGGLAVEFDAPTKGISYLEMPQGIPDFSKAVICLWFRLPSMSFNKRNADLTTALVNAGQIAPIMTFGAPQKGIAYAGPTVKVSTSDGYVEFPDIFDQPSWTAGGTFKVDPSYIGLDCSGNLPTLTFNLQTSQRATITGMQFNRSEVIQWSPFDPNPANPWLTEAEKFSTPGTGYSAGAGVGYITTVVDNSFVLAGAPAAFLIPTSVELSLDHWHCLLMSFDIGNGSVSNAAAQDLSGNASNPTTADGVEAFSRFWYAIDDVNYNGLAGNIGFSGEDDPNAILTDLAMNVADATTGLPYNVAVEGATYELRDASIPTNGGPIGLPASGLFSGDILDIEMAELRVFTGVTLDTGITINRRAFIAADGTPETDYSIAEGLLGKKADIELHRSGNWKLGRNTGEVSAGTVDQLGAGNNFVPTGEIVAYKPDPSLTGPQSPK